MKWKKMKRIIEIMKRQVGVHHSRAYMQKYSTWRFTSRMKMIIGSFYNYLTLHPTKAQASSFPECSPTCTLIYRSKLHLEIRRKQNKTKPINIIKFLLWFVLYQIRVSKRQYSIVLLLSGLYCKPCKFVSTLVCLDVTSELIK